MGLDGNPASLPHACLNATGHVRLPSLRLNTNYSTAAGMTSPGLARPHRSPLYYQLISSSCPLHRRSYHLISSVPETGKQNTVTQTLNSYGCIYYDRKFAPKDIDSKPKLHF